MNDDNFFQENAALIISANVAAIATTAIVAYHLGRQNVLKGNVSKEEARRALPDILDKSEVSHGGTLYSSKVHESGITQVERWRKPAAGSIVAVLSEKDGELYAAMGQQPKLKPDMSGKIKLMRTTQGYMDPEKNKDNESSIENIGEQRVSRINKQTGEVVPADMSIEDAAVREVREELGLKIKKDDLRLLYNSSHPDDNPIVHTVAPVYGIKVEEVPELKVTNHEFKDDLSNPQWHKISDISRGKHGTYSLKGVNIPLEPDSVKAIQYAVKEFATDEQKDKYKEFLNYDIEPDIASARSI